MGTYQDRKQQKALFNSLHIGDSVKVKNNPYPFTIHEKTVSHVIDAYGNKYSYMEIWYKV